MKNPVTHVTELSPQTLKPLHQTQFGPWRLLPMVSFAFDYWWGNGSVAAYHVTNNVIHALCWLACLWMLWVLLSTPRLVPADRDKRFFGALSVATLWALHPVQTSAVTYVVQRMATLQALFFMAAVAAFIQGRLGVYASRAKAAFWWSLAVLFSLGAFLSKENAAMLPVILGLIEVTFFRPRWWAELPRRLGESLKKPRIVLLVILAGVVGFWVVSSLLDSFSKGYEIRHFTMKERLLTEARVVMRYFFTVLVPDPRALSLEHDVEVSRSLFDPPATVLSLAAIAGLLSASLWTITRWPLISFGLLWFFLNLAIESSVVPLELIFDHRMYLPSVGLILAAFEAVRRVFSKAAGRWTIHEREKIAWSAVAVLSAVLCLMTFVRNEDWETAVNINADAVRKAPNHPRAHANLASALIRAGRYAEAVEAAQKAVEVGRDHFEEHFVAATNLVIGRLYLDGEEKALEEAERLLGTAPKAPDATALPNFLTILATLQTRAERYRDAYGSVQKALDVLAKFPRLRSDAPMVYAAMNRLVQAVAEKNEDIDGDGSPDPGELQPTEWIVRKLHDLGDWEGAKRFADTVPASPVAQEVRRVMALAEERNRFQSAQWGYRNYLWKPKGLADVAAGAAYGLHRWHGFAGIEKLGLKLLHVAELRRPDNADVPLLKGWYAFEAGRAQEAVALARQAVALAPQSAKAWIALGFFEQRAGNVERSLAAFQQTLELYPGYPKRQVLQQLMTELHTQLAAQSAEKESAQQANVTATFHARR
ncbi:MAG: tetratricopeptide repeat protein [Desulfosoma sp.]